MLGKRSFKSKSDWLDYVSTEMRRKEREKKEKKKEPSKVAPESRIVEKEPRNHRRTKEISPPKPSCECGTCRKCIQRESMRRLRYDRAQVENQSAVGLSVGQFSPEEDDTMRRVYSRIKYENNAYKAVQKLLPNRTPSQIFRRAVELNLIRRRERIRWTEEELRVVEAFAHCAPETIQRKLFGVTPFGIKRTRAAIVSQIHANKFRSNLDGLNLTGLSQAIGLSMETLKNYMQRGMIRAKKLPSLDMHKGKDVTGSIWFFPTYEIYMFIIRYPGMVDLRRVNQEWFMGIIEWGSRYDVDGKIRGRKKAKSEQDGGNIRKDPP